MNAQCLHISVADRHGEHEDEDRKPTVEAVNPAADVLARILDVAQEEDLDRSQNGQSRRQSHLPPRTPVRDEPGDEHDDLEQPDEAADRAVGIETALFSEDPHGDEVELEDDADRDERRRDGAQPEEEASRTAHPRETRPVDGEGQLKSAGLDRIHVTGGTGFLGRELLRRAPRATSERVDVCDTEAVCALFERLRPDVVIHTAYRQTGPGAWAITVDGAETVAHAAHAVNARFVHFSTDVVFDGLKGAPYVEEDEPCPATEYGRAKAESERRVRAAHPEALVVRTSLLLGGPGHEPSKHELAALNAEMTFYEDEIRCPIQVGDLAAALLELAELRVTGVLHIAGADALSRAELAELAAGRSVARAPAPPGRPLDCTLDCTRARSLLRTELRGIRTVFGARAGDE